MSGCCVVEFERTCLLCDEMIDFMERMVLRKALVDDVQELSTKVSSYV